MLWCKRIICSGNNSASLRHDFIESFPVTVSKVLAATSFSGRLRITFANLLITFQENRHVKLLLSLGLKRNNSNSTACFIKIFYANPFNPASHDSLNIIDFSDQSSLSFFFFSSVKNRCTSPICVIESVKEATCVYVGHFRAGIHLGHEKWKTLDSPSLHKQYASICSRVFL